MAGKSQTSTPGPPERYLVHLEVRFLSASDYVLEYAENLSEGGIFIRGARNLEPMEDVLLRIDLPGFGAFEVEGRVSHVLSQDHADRFGRKAGAGLAITSAPEGFSEALAEYLRLLGSRRDVVVFVAPGAASKLLTLAGYRVIEGDDPLKVAAAVEDTKGVIAVVVRESMAKNFREALARRDLPPDLVLPFDASGPPDKLLNALDRRVLSLIRTSEAADG